MRSLTWVWDPATCRPWDQLVYFLSLKAHGVCALWHVYGSILLLQERYKNPRQPFTGNVMVLFMHCCDLRARQAQSDEADQSLETRCHSWRLNVAPQWDVETWFSDLDSSWNIIGNGPQNLVWTPTIYPRDKSTHPACAKHLRHRQHVLAFRYLTWDGRSQTCKSSSRCFGSILDLVFYSWDCHSLCRQIQIYP